SDHAGLRRVFEQVREAPIAVIALVEPRINALDALLHLRAPDRIVIALERRDGRENPIERFLLPTVGRFLLLAVRGLRLLLSGLLLLRLPLHAYQIVVEDELVAVVREQIGRRLANTAADDALVVLLELRDERREVAVAGDQRERVDVRLRVAEID